MKKYIVFVLSVLASSIIFGQDVPPIRDTKPVSVPTVLAVAVTYTAAVITPVAAVLPDTVTATAAPAGLTLTAVSPVSITGTVSPTGSTLTAVSPVSITGTVSPTGLTLTAVSPVSITGTVSPAGLTLTAASQVPMVAPPRETTQSADDLSPSNINFDTSGLNSIKLTWAPKFKENVYYNVYRSGAAAEYARLNAAVFEKPEYVDSSITSATSYYYKVEAIDLSGNAYFSATRTVKSADIFMPNMPYGFKAYQDIQSIILKWSMPGQTTYAVSGYNIYRGKTSDKQDFIKFIPAQKSNFSDEDVEPAIRYYYSMATADIKGNESKKSDISSTMAFPPPRTGLVTMTSGYRNNIFDNYGLNVDAGFTYYIGSIVGEHQLGGRKVSDNFSKLGLWLLTVDAKWTFFNEFETWPSVGIGASCSLILKDSIGGNSDVRSKSTSFAVGDSLLTAQGLYVAASKKLMFENTVHAGYSMGINKRGIAGFVPYLASSFVSSSESTSADTSLDLRNAYFLGYSRPLINKMGLKVEYVVPVDVNGSINKNPVMPDTYVINTHIDRLINFDIGYIHYRGGYAWVGYINLRFTVYPSPYK